jgi:hypothetical protein
MTLEELQYQFEIREPRDLMRLPVPVITAFALHMIRQIPAQRWIARDWATTSGIVDQFRRTRAISDRQKMFVIGACQRTLPDNLLYLQH